MKEYIKGDKRLSVYNTDNGCIGFDFFNGNIHTFYVKPMREYQSFLNYLLVVWLKVKRG